MTKTKDRTEDMVPANFIKPFAGQQVEFLTADGDIIAGYFDGVRYLDHINHNHHDNVEQWRPSTNAPNPSA